LKIAIAELMSFPEIPAKVSINEAIEIVKRYSTEKSGTFVNGILDSALSELNAAGKLAKSGRGLMDINLGAAKQAQEQAQEKNTSNDSSETPGA
jgi:N utilization substance protein B